MAALRFPSVADVLEVHRSMLEAGGGTPGVLQLGSVEAAVHRARFGPFRGEGDLAERAALLLRGIAQDHPFADGNKRTGFSASATFLEANGYWLEANSSDVVEFMLGVARVDLDIEEITDWIRPRIRKI